MRDVGRGDGADLGDRDLPVGEYLEQERLELLVGAVELVYQQHRRPVVGDRLEQGPLEQEGLAEDVGLALVEAALPPFFETDLEQLALVVPLVQGGAGVESLVALQTDQVGVEGPRHHLGDLRLAYACRPLDEERLVQGSRQVKGHGDGGIGDVLLLAQHLLEAFGFGIRHRLSSAGGGTGMDGDPSRRNGHCPGWTDAAGAPRRA